MIYLKVRPYFAALVLNNPLAEFKTLLAVASQECPWCTPQLRGPGLHYRLRYGHRKKGSRARNVSHVQRSFVQSILQRSPSKLVRRFRRCHARNVLFFLSPTRPTTSNREGITKHHFGEGNAEKHLTKTL